MSSILCVDDDPYLTDLLSYALTREGHTVRLVHRGAEALRELALERPDLVILDGNLPDITGFELCPQIRSLYGLPVIMLTAHHADEDVLAGFANGADDYVSKPFNMQVLIYRVRAVLRRVAEAAQVPSVPEVVSANIIAVGDGLFNVQSNEIIGRDRRVKLTRIEGKVLHLLLTYEGQVFSAERILERVWGYETDSDVSVVKTHVRRLRSKMADVLGDFNLIATVPSMGYTVRASGVRLLQDQALS